MKKKKTKPYTEMTTRELAEATREFDEEFVADRARPMNAAERKLHRDAAAFAKRGRGRPRIGNGAERINVTIERDLLARADALAAARDWKRSEVIASALELFLKRAS